MLSPRPHRAPRRRGRAPGRGWAAVLLLVTSLLLPGCGGEEPAAHCAEVAAAGAAPGAGLGGIRLQKFGTVTATREVPGLSTGTVVSETGIQELVDPVRAAIVDAGYTVLVEENEGFEADFTFTRGPQQHGIVRITDKFDCGVREIQVSIADAAATVSPTAGTAGGSGG